jgi:hypothetical protein
MHRGENADAPTQRERPLKLASAPMSPVTDSLVQLCSRVARAAKIERK